MRHLFRSRGITLRVPRPPRSEVPPPLIRAFSDSGGCHRGYSICRSGLAALDYVSGDEALRPATLSRVSRRSGLSLRARLIR